MNLIQNEPLLEVNDIQGNSLRGFDTKWQLLIGLKSNSDLNLRSWLYSLTPDLSSLEEVHNYRLLRTGNTLPDPKPVLLNASISGAALRLLGFDTNVIGEGLLNLPMGSLAVTLGDSSADVSQYKLGKNRETTPDVLLLIGSEDKDTLLSKSKLLINAAETAGINVIYEELGSKLPGDIEHFGFRDGISQVGVRGLLHVDPIEPLTLRQIDPADPKAQSFSSPGQQLVWPGQFVFGYPTQQEESIEPGPKSGQAEWLKNGSLMAFRRLKQDVAAFRTFIKNTAPKVNLHPETLAAKIVGRWPDGSPVILSPEGPEPSISSDNMHVNHFGYLGTSAINVIDDKENLRAIGGTEADNDVLKCPHFAHIRKVNPRDLHTDQGGPGRTLMMQMLRRGIPFGQLYDPAIQDDSERGLLFISYQTSFNEQFKKLNSQWMNNPDAPEVGAHNHDLLVGQSLITNERVGTLPENVVVKTSDRWVISSGGAFLFSPSISFFRNLKPV